MQGEEIDGRTDASAVGPWSPLRIKVFRGLWIAALVSNVGTFMHLVAAGWAMTSLTSSPVLISLVQTSWAVPGFLLALHAGAFADLVDRRRLIIATQVAALVVAAALGIMQWVGAMSVWGLLVGTFLESVALTIAAPAFMALTPELVDTQRLAQAIGLDAISRNIAQSLGPALAGAVIALTNTGAVFALNAVSFVGVVMVVYGYRPGQAATRSEAGAGAGRGEWNRAIAEGVRLVSGTRQLRNIAVRLTLVMLCTSVLTAVMPVVARTKLGVSAGGFGLLLGALGVGSVLAIQVLPELRSRWSLEVIALRAAVLWAAGASAVAIGSHLWVALIALVVAGVGSMAMLNVLFSTFTVQLPTHARGRGSSLAMLMVWLGASLGAAVWGSVASAAGVDAALWWSAGAMVVAAAVAAVALPIVSTPTG